MCFTWNLELDQPKDAVLDKCFVEFLSNQPKIQRPEMIVIGLQETASYTVFGNTFIGHKLAGKKLLGGINFEDPYELVETVSFKGVTSKGQIISKKAQQAIQVLVRKSAKDKIKVAPLKKSRGFFSEKGFVGVDVEFFGKRLNFISTHLDAKTEAHRLKDCETIIDTLHELSGKGAYDGLWLMGDLNFRIPPFDATFDINGKVSLKHVDPEDYTPKPTDSRYMIDLLRSRDGRKMLMAHDSFHKTEAFKGMPYVWPKFHPDSLPTYKRKHKSKHYKLIQKLEDVIDKDGKIAQTRLPEIQNLFTSKGVVKFKKKRGQWDMGWLDRIGYAVGVDGHHSESMGIGLGRVLKKGLRVITQPGGYTLHVFNHIPCGDHAPVACNFHLDVDGKAINMLQDEKYKDDEKQLDVLDDSDEDLEGSDYEDEPKSSFGFEKSPESNFGLDDKKKEEPPPSSFF